MTIVAFDASCTAKQKRTGVGRYAACLLDALIPKLATRTRAGVTLGFRLSRWRRAGHRYKHASPIVRERWFIDALAGPLLGEFDLFHGLDARLPRGVSGKMIATLHDVGAVKREEIAKAGFRDKKLAAYRDLAERADRIVCVSAATRDAFVEVFPTPLSKFAVVHHGIPASIHRPDDAARAQTRARLELPDRFVFFVGLLSARKNLTILIEAFDRVAAKDRSLWLILAGARAHGYEHVERAIARCAAKDRIWEPGFVSDADLCSLYAESQAFVFPGLEEGFGIPMLEAMTCGTPVIAADRPVSREVAGDAAVFVETTQVESLSYAIERLVGDQALRTTLIERGEEHAKQFTWDAAASRTLEVYDELLGSGRKADSATAARR